MKETQQIHKDKIEVVSQSQVKKQAYLGNLKPHSGHILFEFNIVTKEIKRASFIDDKTICFNQKGSPNKKVNVKENCYYISSLNEKNAVKKIHKLFNVPYVIAINE